MSENNESEDVSSSSCRG